MNPTTEAVEPNTPADKTAEELEKDVQSDTLDASDRCDLRGCGSQAYVKAEMANGDLLFCSHHFNEIESKIEPVAASITDERWKLLKTVKLDVSA